MDLSAINDSATIISVKDIVGCYMLSTSAFSNCRADRIAIHAAWRINS